MLQILIHKHLFLLSSKRQLHCGSSDTLPVLKIYIVHVTYYRFLILSSVYRNNCLSVYSLVGNPYYVLKERNEVYWTSLDGTLCVLTRSIRRPRTAYCTYERHLRAHIRSSYGRPCLTNKMSFGHLLDVKYCMGSDLLDSFEISKSFEGLKTANGSFKI